MKLNKILTNSDNPISSTNKKIAIINENIPTITVELNTWDFCIHDTLPISILILLKYPLILEIIIKP